MPGKKINQLDVRTPTLADLMLIGDPSTGYSYKAALSALITFVTANITTGKKRFVVGDAGFPGDGASSWTDSDFTGATVWVYRNGLLLDWADPGDGSSYYIHSGNTITFYPALATFEKIQALVIKI